MRLFNSANLNLGSTDVLNIIGNISVSCFGALTDTGALQVIIGAYDSTGSPFSGWAIGFSISGSNKLSYWSNGNGAWQNSNTNVGDQVRRQYGFTINGTGAGAGTFYFNGVADGTWSHTAPSSFSGTKRIGATSTSGSELNGSTLGEVAVWNVAITAAEMAALAKGFSPLIVHPRNLVMYFPIWGNVSPEKDPVGGLSGDVQFSIGNANKSDNPRVFYPG